MQHSSPFSAQLYEHGADLMRCFFAYRETLLRKRLFVSTLGSWTRLVTLGLGLADLGHGLSAGIAKIATAPDVKAEAVKDAVALTQAGAQEAATPQAGQSAQVQQPALPAANTNPTVPANNP